MALKAIYDIEVNDAAFKRFQALYDKHVESLKKLPGAWSEVGKEQKASADAMAGIAAAVLATNDLLETTTNESEKLARHSTTTSRMWTALAGSSTVFANNIVRAAQTALHTAEISGAVGGLLGAGGLYGLDQLALGAGDLRRTVTGLGTSAGAYQALGVDMGRYFNTAGASQSVLNARSNLSDRWIFSSMGINPDGMDNSDLTAATADAARTMWMNSDRTAQFAKARGLDQIYSINDLNTMAAAPNDEWAKSQADRRRHTGDLSIQDKTLKAWQDFEVQLDIAGTKLKTTLIEGLVGLTKPLSDVSDGFTNVVKAFLKSDIVKDGLDKLAAGLNGLATFLGSDWMKQHGADVAGPAAAGAGAGLMLGGPGGALVGGAVGAAAGWYGSGPAPTNPMDKVMPDVAKNFDRMTAYALNNPGGIKDKNGNFVKYDSMSAGVMAMDKQLLLYQNRDHLSTVSDIITKYEGGPSNPDHNDIAGYIKDVSSRTGYDPNQKLNLSDSATMANLISAMARHENGKFTATPQQVQVIITNKTGAGTNATAAQTAQQQ